MAGNSYNPTTIWTPQSGFLNGGNPVAPSGNAPAANPFYITNPDKNGPSMIQDPSATGTPQATSFTGSNGLTTTGVMNPFGLSQNNPSMLYNGAPAPQGSAAPAQAPSAAPTPSATPSGENMNTTPAVGTGNSAAPAPGMTFYDSQGNPRTWNGSGFDEVAPQGMDGSGRSGNYSGPGRSGSAAAPGVNNFTSTGPAPGTGQSDAQGQSGAFSIARREAAYAAAGIRTDGMGNALPGQQTNQQYGAGEAEKAAQIRQNFSNLPGAATPGNQTQQGFNTGTFNGNPAGFGPYSGNNLATPGASNMGGSSANPASNSPAGGLATPTPGFNGSFQQGVQIYNPLGVNAANEKQWATDQTAQQLAQMYGGSVSQQQLEGPGYGYSTPQNQINVPGARGSFNAGLMAENLNKYGSGPTSYGQYLNARDIGTAMGGGGGIDDYGLWATSQPGFKINPLLANSGPGFNLVPDGKGGMINQVTGQPTDEAGLAALQQNNYKQLHEQQAAQQAQAAQAPAPAPGGQQGGQGATNLQSLLFQLLSQQGGQQQGGGGIMQQLPAIMSFLQQLGLGGGGGQQQQPYRRPPALAKGSYQGSYGFPYYSRFV